ncbi:hypothetical protein [Paenibacillus silvisoli]|uniref:hypothetical protein n=1 Tax=Paenibacillus silvisoli TaxID=3110539 RepID=UPI002804C0A6|nr:hypothetical protein [Paenibacillus silvisoli]
MSRAKEIMDVGVIPSMGIMLNGPGVISTPPQLDTQLHYFKETALYLHEKNLNPLLALAGCHKSGVYSPIKEFFKAI